MSALADPRPPLDAAGVAVPDGWRLEVAAEVTSTNVALGERYRAGERAGLVLVAEHQSAGRGRLGREWVVAPGSSLTVSVLLEPDAAPERWAWLPLLTGVAAARAVRDAAGEVAGDGVAVALKWPNDVLLGEAEGKVGGILLERVEHEGRAAAVVGVGLNVHQRRDELPVDTATSLALGGAEVGREALLSALLRRLAAAYDAWAGGPGVDGAGDAALRDDYLALCTTPGREVRVVLPGGELEGTALDVDPDGRLVVRTAAGEERLGAGDVVHVRPQPSA
ncbi:biotin--[acetyl-CoA-carboxylase] ligase [Nocardioides marmoraquaticus]